MPTSTTTQSSIKCPVELDAIFKLEYSVEGLKQVLTFILENLNELHGFKQNTLDELDK